jgi:hypothetical protein
MATFVDNGAFPHLAVRAASVRGSIVAGSTCGVPSVDDDHNLRSPDPCTGTGTAADLGLTPLADHGGLTATLLPLAGSPAVDAIPDGSTGLCQTGFFDQRFLPRPVGSACDIGATERQLTDA